MKVRENLLIFSSALPGLGRVSGEKITTISRTLTKPIPSLFITLGLTGEITLKNIPMTQHESISNGLWFYHREPGGTSDTQLQPLSTLWCKILGLEGDPVFAQKYSSRAQIRLYSCTELFLSNTRDHPRTPDFDIPLSHFWISATCGENKYFYLVSPPGN